MAGLAIVSKGESCEERKRDGVRRERAGYGEGERRGGWQRRRR